METPFSLPKPTRTKNSSGNVSDRRICLRNLETESKCKTQVLPKHNRLKRTKTHKGLENFTDYGNRLTHVTETPESNASCDVILINGKEKLFADAALTIDGKDNSVCLPISSDLPTESIRNEGRHSQTLQKVSQMQNGVSTKGFLKRNKLALKRMSSNMGVQFFSIPAERERGSSDRSLKPDIDHFAADKEVLSSCLRINTSKGDRLMNQPEVNIGQTPESKKHHDIGQALTLITPRTAHNICRESTNVKILREMMSGWRNEFPNEISSEFLEEIQILNLQFPIHRFLTLLLRKRTTPEEESSALAEKNDDSKHPSASSVQRKRKRELQEQMCDRTYKSPKTNKGSISADKLDFEQFSDSLTHSHAKYRNRLSRTKRRQQQTTCCPVVTEPMQDESVHQDPWPGCLQRVDVLWTDKYNPQQSREVIGNSASVRQLHSWLKEWKLRADIEERRRRQEEKRMKEENSNESWDCGDFEGDTVSIDHEKELCNTVLMIGPSGVGKTAAVYACAQELGFKVFEVNSSVLRCGRLILSQLTEATQSHQVDIQKMKTLKPEIINQSKIKPAPPCDEANRKVTSSKGTSNSPSVSCLSGKPVNLTRFFKLSSKKSVGKTSDGPERRIHAVELKPGRLQSSGSGFKDKREGNKELTCSSKDPTSVMQSQTIPMSLILFEEVDVIFPEDVGFLAAIRTFMSTTKRPIILTTNDPLFGRRLKGHFDEIHFQTPSLQTIRSYLQCMCVVENMRTDPEDMAFLLCQNKGDIRRSILQLQLWVCSGGGRTEQQILKNTLKVSQCGSWTELENSRCLEILAEKTGGGLLYSNIERLFSPHCISQSSHHQESINPKTKGEKPVKGLILQTSTNVNEVKPDRLSTRRGQKRLSSCEPKNISYLHSDLKLFSVPSKQTNHLASETDVHGQDNSLMLVFQHLVCIAKFFDNMSFLDAYLQRPSLSGTGYCKPEPLGWMGATLKDSLLDLPREEQIGQCFENSSQILAIVEGLGFLQCQTEFSGIWMEAVRLREKLSSERWEQIISALSLPSDIKNLKLCHCKFCAPSGIQKRKEIVSILISSKKVCCHNNKPALSMDYLPTLRSICRSERVKEQHSFRRSHYLSNLNLPRSTLDLMALDFP
ncbi:ATPase family AAA domain-containing protein 5b isoform X2 [Ctenopharyngodon idella]|uniref:ATPase family AAA domain-containing protein 5b isoform X2 n=1 Tax=Ctenopharyngodon idella TaxID=7959 RepID=UPI00222EDC3B|nr:ATPase family AAA domain-containing protein 5b isoform X2 [Ctenopharyngodon idella]